MFCYKRLHFNFRQKLEIGNICSKQSQEALGEGEREMLLKEVKNEKDRRI